MANCCDHAFNRYFTASEPQVELCEAAFKQNTIVSFISQAGKYFICNQAIQYFINFSQGKRVLCVTKKQNASRYAELIRRLSCYSVFCVKSTNCSQIKDAQVIVTTVDEARSLLNEGSIDIESIGLFILNDCQRAVKDSAMRKLVKRVLEGNKSLRVLGLGGSLMSAMEQPYVVQTEAALVEDLLGASLNMASDSVTILQNGNRPRECLMVYQKFLNQSDVIVEIEIEINRVKSFLNDHNYEPLVYEGFEEDKLEIPNPVAEPKQLLDSFLYVLHNFGLWPSNIAAYVILLKIEILKIRTPYERHFLLLGVVSSVFVRIRAILGDFFDSIAKGDVIRNYSSAQIIRLLSILRQFRDKTEPYYAKINECENFEEAESTNDAGKSEEKRKNGRIDDRGKWKRTRDWKGIKRPGKEPVKAHEMDPHTLCGLILVNDDFMAKFLFYLLSEVKTTNDEFAFLRIHFTIGISDDLGETALERAFRKQEVVLRHFRARECNLLIGTSFLESGLDLPRCNLVVRFDPPKDFRSYAQGKAKARGSDALHILMAPTDCVKERLRQLASYHTIEKIFSKENTPNGNVNEESEADRYNSLVMPFRPSTENSARADLNSAVFLLNRYCAKLPSDTFTRLTPIWRIISLPQLDLFICVIRLPINSPIKKAIVGPAMPTVALARRFAALQACLALHRGREIDNTLSPITKENFWGIDEDPSEGDDVDFDAFIRPGTTKRRQYYNKKIAECFTDCRPVPGVPCYLYHISMTLTCPLPEEQNTRGRKIRPPEDSPRGFGILTSRPIPAVGLFPIFTRSGEVGVELELAQRRVTLSEENITKIVHFINFTFTSVLRLQKYLMMFDPNASENSYFIVPTCKSRQCLEVDWNFLDVIFDVKSQMPTFEPDEERVQFTFHPEKYDDAVVCPWYRNQDQPQYFYVAEICHYLSPTSAFPGSEYNSFEAYYLYKYGIQIQNLTQALLDVDHTSARLNFLTPRYVNRKGVALPTTSEAKKRAKRENLGQKQILVPELCNIHPFPASLWQKAVCLPCILHRLNSLLLSNEVRRLVARELGLGDPGDPETRWKPLDFGWNLADVLHKGVKAFNDSSHKESGTSPSVGT